MQSLKKQESVLSSKDALQSGLPVFQKIIKSEGKTELAAYIISKTILFIQNNFPSTANQVSVAGEFAEDLIEQRIDWRVPDVELFFKFIKHNQGVIAELKTYGNIITPIRLCEMASEYEDKRASEREQIERDKIHQLDNAPIESPKMQEWLNKIYQQMEALKRKVEYTEPETLRVLHGQHEQSIIDSIPNCSNEVLEIILIELEKHYSVIGENKKFLYSKAIQEIKKAIRE